MPELTSEAIAPYVDDKGLTGAVRLLAGPLVFRGASLLIMMWLMLWAEARPAPALPDILVQRIPYFQTVDRWNYVVWTLAYVPAAVLFLLTDVQRFRRYLIAGGWLAIVRGLCVAATGLGPVNGPDLHAGIDANQRLSALFDLVVPFNGFISHQNPFYLTKDLFFSGHTSSTLLLLLYVWKFPRLRLLMLAAHVAVVLSVFMSHLHYTIDVVGAYAITFSVFVLMETDLRALLQGRLERA
jgi:hypothetical protein